MESKNDIFKKINDAVLDLQASSLQSYEHPLINLGRLLKDPVLMEFNSEITKNIDLQNFIEESESTEGSMAGSARLMWTNDPIKTLGLKYLLIIKFAEDPEFMLGFGFTFYYDDGNTLSEALHNVVRQLIIPFVRDYKDYVMENGSKQNQLKIPLSKKVFVVHGHDNFAKESVARFLERFGFQAVILHEHASQGRTVIEKVEAYGDVGFAVVLLTPDDEGYEKGKQPEPRARQNVLLELGYFIGRLGRSKVCALKRGELEIPSDFAGIVWVPMDEGNAWKVQLANELKAAGHAVDLNLLTPH